MATTKAQQKAVHKYVKNNYDRMELTVPKGSRDIIKVASAKAGQSVNAYIWQAVQDRLNREQAQPEPEPAHSTANTEPARESQPAPTE